MLANVKLCERSAQCINSVTPDFKTGSLRYTRPHQALRKRSPISMIITFPPLVVRWMIHKKESWNRRRTI
jgi:hypothetical protein